MLDRTHRFKGHTSLGFVHRRGQVVRGQNITLKYTLNNRQTKFRVAIVVSRKVSKSAVVRNRIRRRIYEAVRQAGPNITKPYDLVFVVYSSEFAILEPSKLSHRIIGLLTQASIFK